ncbi:MAG: lipoyl(octanoyl) transferase LipB, partial [Pseudomonadota bacterium]|nr:lipoyl(octanoyl) transferase LipB [Pseudomonadota bacterium]
GKIGVRDLVTALENAVIDVLDAYGVRGWAKPDAPGVYVETAMGEAKIASLGLRIRRGASYHGVALNVDGDLSPFARINPCGYAGMQVTCLADLVDLSHGQDGTNGKDVGERLAQALAARLKRTLVVPE